MKRLFKKNTCIYNHLQSTGILDNGTDQEIAAAKKLYWSEVHKRWKQEHRNERISHTIFFSKKEQRLLQQAAINSNLNITKLIKNACLQMLASNPVVDKRIVGKIRQELALLYAELEKLNDVQSISLDVVNTLLIRFASCESIILALLMNTKSAVSVD